MVSWFDDHLVSMLIRYRYLPGIDDNSGFGNYPLPVASGLDDRSGNDGPMMAA